MKYVLIFLMLISETVLGQSITYSEWKVATKTDIRLLPKYGNVNKTKEQIESDQRFIKTTLASERSNRKASNGLVDLGFAYLYKNDLKTAMSRFNQAWLLDPKNEDIFLGFGAIYATFGDFQNALKQYDEGLLINPKSSNLLTDKGNVFMTKYERDGNEKDFTSAIKFFKLSYSINPKYESTLYKLSAIYLLKKDCVNSWKYYYECKKIGSKLITKDYTDALTKLCKK